MRSRTRPVSQATTPSSTGTPSTSEWPTSANFAASGALLANVATRPCWSRASTLTASRPERRIASNVREPVSMQTIISTGSSDSEQTALAVRPEGPFGPALVTTVTPLAKWPIARL
jgi:hypothetical protein